MQELREVTILSPFTLPVSFFLRSTPMLHSLSLHQNAIVDDKALVGMSNGTLGQFLRRLAIHVCYDFGEVLDMVEARKKTVDELIKSGCSWREEITNLKDILPTTQRTTKKGLLHWRRQVSISLHMCYNLDNLIYTVILLQVNDHR
jgi:hypothetical protein